MSQRPDVLWLNVSPALRGFDRPLLQLLSPHMSVAEWRYGQTVDEPTCLETALVLLHDYLQPANRPLHLIGHSTGGLLGLLYAQRFPERVRSLTLLAVGAHPAVDWQAHYYTQRHLLHCPREMILTQTVYNLLGYQSRPVVREFVRMLDRDLETSLSPHTLYQRVSIAPGGIQSPLMVCGAADDPITDPMALENWQTWMKPGDRLWTCPDGRYFFHYFHPQQVADTILDFWRAMGLHPVTSSIPQGVNVGPG